MLSNTFSVACKYPVFHLFLSAFWKCLGFPTTQNWDIIAKRVEKKVCWLSKREGKGEKVVENNILDYF